MFKLLHRAVFQAHVTAGVLTSGYLVHRILNVRSRGQHASTTLLPRCPLIQYYLKRNDAEKEDQNSRDNPLTLDDQVALVAQTTVVITGLFALMGATWWFSYPLAIYFTQNKINREWATSVFGPCMR